MQFFFQANPDSKVCLLSLSRDSTLPKLTSNSKQQLLFHGCVQAEPGHLHWVTGLLAVFVVPSKVCCILPHAAENCVFALVKIKKRDVDFLMIT